MSTHDGVPACCVPTHRQPSDRQADQRQPTATAPTPAAIVVTEHVHALRRRTRRRVFPPSAYVYPTTPDGRLYAVEPVDLLARLTVGDLRARNLRARNRRSGELDHALRVELLLGGLERLIGSTGHQLPAELDAPSEFRAAAIVVRSGPVEPSDEDRAWWRALIIASGVLGTGAAAVYAVTRRGWLDVNDPRPVLVPRRRLPDSGSQCPSSSRYSEEVRRKVS